VGGARLKRFVAGHCVLIVFCVFEVAGSLATAEMRCLETSMTLTSDDYAGDRAGCGKNYAVTWKCDGSVTNITGVRRSKKEQRRRTNSSSTRTTSVNSGAQTTTRFRSE
jgi:hypothetical protein